MVAAKGANNFVSGLIFPAPKVHETKLTSTEEGLCLHPAFEDEDEETGDAQGAPPLITSRLPPSYWGCVVFVPMHRHKEGCSRQLQHLWLIAVLYSRCP